MWPTSVRSRGALRRRPAARGRAARADLPGRATRRQRPRARGDARQSGRRAVRRLKRPADRGSGAPPSIASSAASISSCTVRRSPCRPSCRIPSSQTSREGFRIALDVSAYSLIGLTRAVLPLMERRGGGSVLTLTYLGSQRVVPNYNVMGVAKAALEASVRYLAADLGPQNIRVNAISAGPIKTLAATGISGFSEHAAGLPGAGARSGAMSKCRGRGHGGVPAGSCLARRSPVRSLMVDAGFHAVGARSTASSFGSGLRAHFTSRRSWCVVSREGSSRPSAPALIVSVIRQCPAHGAGLILP